MRRLARPLGLALAVFGTLVALFPFISVWRASGQVLEQLPPVSGADAVDERNRLGVMFDDDFVLARRTYKGVTSAVVVDALSRDGFESIGVDRLSKVCCGDYDAVWVDVEAGDAGSVVAVLTVEDSDWQVSWPIFAVIGALVAITGLAIGLARGEDKLDVARRTTEPHSKLRS